MRTPRRDQRHQQRQWGQEAALGHQAQLGRQAALVHQATAAASRAPEQGQLQSLQHVERARGPHIGRHRAPAVRQLTQPYGLTLCTVIDPTPPVSKRRLGGTLQQCCSDPPSR